MSTLKETVKNRILNDMIKTVQPEKRWKVLVVDALSLRIITTVCRMNDILEENVTLIEDITRKRQAFPTQDAIYFITPTTHSVDLFIGDYSGTSKLYAAAHLFFTSPLPDDMFQMIKNSPALQHVKTLKELNIEYLALEQQAFVLDMPDSFYTLYNPTLNHTLDQELTQMAKKMVSIVSSLGEYPSIRYYAQSTAPSPPSKLANLLQIEVDKFCENDESVSKVGNQLIFMIVERSVDVLTPLLHEFTYQAMMHDLLSFSDHGKYQIKEESGDKKVMATLDEYDSIWNLIRHWHYVDAVEYISNTFTKFIENNKAASAAMGGTKDASGIDGINAMKDLLSSLPEFQEMRLKYSTHINVCQECKDMFAKRQLDIVASIEQDLSTGETVDGKKPKNILLTILPLLDDKHIPNTDKIRLLMIYIISQDGIHDTDRRRLLEQTKLSADESQSITNLNALGVRLTPAQKSDKIDKGPYSYYAKKPSQRKQDASSDAMGYDLSRYVPMMKYMMEDLANDKLDTHWFPYTKESKQTTPRVAISSNTIIASADASNPYSLRTTRANWKTKVSATSPTNQSLKDGPLSSEKSVGYRKNGPTIVLFVIGGMTYSEMRSTYEVMNELKRDVIIGSTHVFTPVQFLDALQDVHLGAMRQPELKTSNLSTNLEVQLEDKKNDKKSLGFGVFKKK